MENQEENEIEQTETEQGGTEQANEEVINNTMITPFDNEVSILYKIANRLDQPVKYIVGIPLTGSEQKELLPETLERVISNYRYEPLVSVIEALLIENTEGEGMNLERIYEQLTNDNIILLLTTRIPYEISMIYFLLNYNRKPIERLLDEINGLFIVTENRNEEISDANELLLKYQNWRREYQLSRNRDIQSINEIIELQNILSSAEALPMSKLVIDNVTVRAAPRARIEITEGETEINDQITIDDGIELFDTSILSENVPYIQYNGDINVDVNIANVNGTPNLVPMNKYYKIFTGRTSDTSPNYTYIIPSSTKTTRPNTVYMTVWSGEGDVRKATQESYMRAIYHLDENVLMVNSPVTEGHDENLVLSRIETTLPINIGPTTEYRVSGSFILYNIDIEDTTFVDMLLTDKLMYSYLYIDETLTPFAQKKRLNIHFRSVGRINVDPLDRDKINNPSSVTATLTQNYATKDQDVEILGENGLETVTIESGIPYINVKITRATSREVAQQFMSIFNRLMSYYYNNREDIEDQYRPYFPNLTFTPLKSKETVGAQKSKGKTSQSKIGSLKNLAPDLFVSRYARICQKHKQPLIINEGDIEYWQSNEKRIERKGTQQKRQIMRFPREPIEGRQWIFVCPNDQFPYPGVRLNTNLSNREIYPYVPCCFGEDKMDPNANSLYNEYYRGRIRTQKDKAKSAHVISTAKIAEPGRRAEVSGVITDLLSRYAYDSNKIYRYGVVRSLNSLLHCVLVALNGSTYMSLQTDEERENYVMNFRKHIAMTINPGLLKQELYDFSDDEIRSQLENMSLFLDPMLYYRAIEETFQINIFVFSINSVSSGGTEKTTSYLELPRFKLFHARPYRKRMSVIIFKNLGSESDNLTYPQCELIVDYNDRDKNEIRHFGEEMTQLLYNTILGINRTITWSIQSSGPTSSGSNTSNTLPVTDLSATIVARENIYSKINFDQLIDPSRYRKANEKRVTGQILDNYGKLRALIFEVAGQQITMVIPPSQPENISTVTQPNTLPEINLVLTVFANDPVAVTRSTVTNNINGLWYQVMDITYGIYIPVNETNIDIDLPIGPPDPLFTQPIQTTFQESQNILSQSNTSQSDSSQSVVSRIRKMRRDINIILQLILWVYLLSDLSVDAFMKQYIFNGELSNNQIDSSNIYDFSSIKRIRHLPLVESASEAIIKLQEVVPSLIRDNKIYLYSNKLTDGVEYFLEQYELTHQGLPTVIQRQLVGLYQFETDFTPQQHTALFINEDNLRTWLNSVIKSSTSNLMIRDRLDISYSLLIQPYLYITPVTDTIGGKIYLIQNINIPDRALDRALNVAYRWSTSKINPGYLSPPYNTLDNNTKDLSYVIYGISKASTLILLEDHRTQPDSVNSNFMEILFYGNSQYGAMLPML